MTDFHHTFPGNRCARYLPLGVSTLEMFKAGHRTDKRAGMQMKAYTEFREEECLVLQEDD